MRIGEVLKNAWQRTFRYKALWLYGLLLLGTSSGNINLNLGERINPRAIPANPNQLQSQLLRFIQQIGEENLIKIGLVIMIVGIFLGLIVLFLSPIASGGLSLGALLGQEQKPADSVSIAGIFAAIKQDYWAIFRLNILLALVAVLVMVVLMFPTACLTAAFGKAGVLMIPMMILTILATLVIQIISYNARFFLVEKHSSARASLETAWEITKNNFKSFFGIHLLILVIMGIINLLIALPVIWTALPMIVNLDFTRHNLPLLAVVTIFSTAISFLLSGILNPFIYHTFVQYYDRFKYAKASNPFNETDVPLVS